MCDNCGGCHGYHGGGSNLLSETLSCVWGKCSKCIVGWMGANAVGIMGCKGVGPNNAVAVALEYVWKVGVLVGNNWAVGCKFSALWF